MFVQKSSPPNIETINEVPVTESNKPGENIELDSVNTQNEHDRDLSNSNSTTEDDTETRRTYTGTISDAEDVNRIVQIQEPARANKKIPRKYYILATVVIILIGVLIIIYALSTGSTKENALKNKPFWRIPQTIRPLKYDLTLRPNIEKGPYSGTVNITINATVPFTQIVLHSQNLSIEQVILQTAQANYSTVPVGYYLYSSNPKKDLKENMIITTETVTAKGLYYLAIEFKGDLRNKFVGFYRSTYKNEKGDVRKIATSKFEPTYARQAFPCFDEPAFKAKFHVHIEKPKGSEYLALSNFPKVSEEDTENGVMVHFQETDIKMSTYLACFIVCDFKFTANSFQNKGGKNEYVPFNVYATPQQLDKTKYAADVGKKIMEFYVDYFNIPYPLPKFDMIAIPDFVSGAMEHWGLVTYRETALLYNDKYHSAGNKQRVATVVGHELAHSWFGNLVTMSWWDNLWLNEGFASYIEYKGVDHAEPTWQIMQQFLIEDLHNILDRDAKINSHPIIQTVETPDQITEVFDLISYAKGASVLRMLENVVGPVNFQKGVTDYLNKFAFGNAVSDDLIQAVENHFPNHGIAEFLKTFTNQTGYPVVTVEYTDDNNFKLTQKRFVMGSNEKFTNTWMIPIRYRIVGDGSESQVFWFNKDEEQLIIKRPENKLIKFNPEQVGFYRVNYPLDYWLQLIQNYPKLSVGDRTHLLEESFSLAAAGELSYDIPLNLIKQLVNEVDYIPWAAAKVKLAHLKTVLGSSINNFVKDIVKNAYEKLSWTESPTDGHLIKLARGNILDIACDSNVDGAIEEAGKKFKAWFEAVSDLSPDLRAIIYKYGIKKLSEDEYNAVLAKYAKEIDAGEKQKLMYGLANVDSEDLIKKLITWIWDEKKVRSQDYLQVLQMIAANPKGTTLVWDYVTRNWEDIVKRYTLNDRNLGNMIIGITKHFRTPEDYNAMKEFYAKYPEAGAGARARQQALETVMNNIQWIEQYKEEVEAWLSNYCINCR